MQVSSGEEQRGEEGTTESDKGAITVKRILPEVIGKQLMYTAKLLSISHLLDTVTMVTGQ